MTKFHFLDPGPEPETPPLRCMGCQREITEDQVAVYCMFNRETGEGSWPLCAECAPKGRKVEQGVQS